MIGDEQDLILEELRRMFHGTLKGKLPQLKSFQARRRRTHVCGMGDITHNIPYLRIKIRIHTYIPYIT
jgi:hypothetical protein